MIAALLSLLLGQPLNLNAQPIKSLACDGGLVCSVSGSRATIINTVTGGGGGGGTSDYDGGYNLVQNGGVDLTKRTTIDFTGAGVTCTDTGSKTQCTIAGGGGAGGPSPYVLSFGGF